MTRAAVAARSIATLTSAGPHSTGHHASSAATTAGVSVGHVLVQMVVALVVVVGCIWTLGKVVGRSRHRLGPRASRRAPSSLTVLSRQSLGKGLALAAVKWGDREVLVGIAGSTITFLDDGGSDDGGSRDPDEEADAPPSLGAERLRELQLTAQAPRPAPARLTLLESLRQATARR